MDEGAFVESLFAPEMCAQAPPSQSTSSAPPSAASPTFTSSSSCGRASSKSCAHSAYSHSASSHPRAAESFSTSANTMFRSSLGVVLPPQSLPHHHHHHGLHYPYQEPYHPGVNLHARLTVGPEDDEVFRQLWYEPEQDDHPLQLRMSGGSIVAHVNEEPDDDQDQDDSAIMDHPPSSTNSLLLEPLELPPSSTASTGSLSLAQTLKDAFLNFPPESPAASPLAKVQSLNASYMRTARNSLYDQEQTASGSTNMMMPVMPLRHQEYQNGHAMAHSNTSNTSSSAMNAILGIQNAPWMHHNSSDASGHAMNHGYQPQRMMHNPSSNGSMRQLLMSATAPSALMASVENSSPLWISASNMMMTPTSQLPAPELGRKISNKKSKARRPAKTPPRASAAASALAFSLAGASKTNNMLNSPVATMKSDRDQPSTPESGSDKNAKGKKCVEPGCVRRAQSNSRCKAHGGGARCQYTGPGGCTRSSQGGGFCRAHGGGKRCEYPGCARGQQRKGRCYVHGGIRKCQMGDCEKKDRGNGFCISHGGGKRCEHPGCSRAVRRGLLCQLHEIGN